MRQIIYKKKQSLQKNRRVISIRESSNHKEYATRVNKRFIYMVKDVRAVETELKQPEIFITKTFDTKKKEERFVFHVRGAFFLVEDNSVYKVNFRHSLKITIQWKKNAKNFSPKKSALLTE